MKVPAKNTSNIIRFIPEECAGINDVQAGASAELVFGGKGEITAPENAEIYTASGIRCGRTGLAAGIYIVRTDGKTTKVIVK